MDCGSPGSTDHDLSRRLAMEEPLWRDELRES